MTPGELAMSTVKVTARSGVETVTGTAFFVLPGFLLTCCHVVADQQGGILPEIRLEWPRAAEETVATVVAFRGDEYKEARFPFPDLALLSFDLAASPQFAGHPTVRLSEDVHEGEEVYVYGYSKLNFYGEPVRLAVDGMMPVTAMSEVMEAIKLSDGQVISGISGGPVLNKRTGCVCGIVKRSRSEQTYLGGYAVSATTIRRCFPQLEACFAPPPAPDLNSMLASFYEPPELSSTDKDALVLGLLRCPKLQTASGRNQLVNELPDDLKFSVETKESPKDHVTSIVTASLGENAGLQSLFERLAFFDGSKIPFQRLGEAVQAIYERRRAGN